MAQHKFLTLKEKVNIINVQELDKLSVRQIAKRFNIGKTQAAHIIKNKNSFKSELDSGVNILQKRKFLKAGGLRVDKLCHDWFVEAKRKNVAITGPIIKAKAVKIAERIKYSGFKASDGWLHKWCKRHSISFKTIHAETFNVIPSGAEQLNKLFASTRRSEAVDEIIQISDSEEEKEIKTSGLITSFQEALRQIARLKQFAINSSLEAFEKLNDLEHLFLEQQKLDNTNESSISQVLSVRIHE